MVTVVQGLEAQSINDFKGGGEVERHGKIKIHHLLQLLSHLCNCFPLQLDQILGSMIEMWVDRMDNITQPERRKLSALALLSLLPSLNG